MVVHHLKISIIELTLLTIDSTLQKTHSFTLREGENVTSAISSDHSLQAWFLLPNHVTLDQNTFFQHYRDQGIQCFNQLPHCFALFLYDKPTSKWIVAVDRFASIPLYYFQGKEKTYLSNKMENLTLLTGNDSLNPQSILAYFYFHFIPSPLTCSAHIKKMIPGNAMIIQGKQCIEIPYAPKEHRSIKIREKEDASSFCLQLLENSVKPYTHKNDCGVFLSGGLDSSTLLYLLSKSQKNFPTFSIFFQEKNFDESVYSKLMAAATQSKHYSYIYDSKTFAQDIQYVLPRLSQPFGNLSLFPSYQIAKMAKELGIHTLVAGDGGDEVFGGNHRYLLQNQYQTLQNLPYLMRTLLFFLVKIRYPRQKYQRLLYKFNTPLPLRLYTDSFLYHWKINEIFDSDFLDMVDIQALEEIFIFHYSDLMHLPFQKRLLQYDWRFTLSDNDLVKVRQACEIAGVDVVFPYLCPKIFEYTMSLPTSALFTLRQLRPFFRKMVKPYLPDVILRKPKHGFSLPFGPWLKTDKTLQTLIYSAANQFKSQHILNAKFIENLIQQTYDHPTYYSVFIWLIASLQLWKNSHTAMLKTGSEHTFNLC
jgi:asparagine synthase (glutamine-hydrolysing)